MRGCFAPLTVERKMNKREVAEELECSTRQVEKYVGAGRLAIVEYRKGKSGREGVYNPAAVAMLKVELERERAEVIGNPPPVSALATTHKPAPPQALALVEQITAGIERQHTDAAQIVSVLESLRDLMRSHDGLGEVALKLTLSVSEASRLSGFSKDALRDAIRAGELKAKIIAGRRGWTIKRPDLESYVSKL